MKFLACLLTLCVGLHAERLLTIFQNAIPANPSVNDPNAIELGMRFTATADGIARGIRFYKGNTANGGTHVGTLWTNTGSLLDTCTFSGETSSGWQSCTLTGNVPILSGVIYVVSYHSPLGDYSGDSGFFASSFTNQELSALQDLGPNNNGLFLYGAGGFPTNTFGSTNYYVDITVGFNNFCCIH